MAENITHYKVFIASPGGLEAERKSFKQALVNHNEADAIERSCYFQAVGWEITLGGIGRPQEKINQDLKSCDYFVLVLGGRWGSSTGKAGVSSGTHEEYMLANELLQNPSFPMREIVVFFRGVDPAILADPGLQLQKVLDFKRQIEEDKKLLFETFDSPESFSDKLKRHLASWTRYHESLGKVLPAQAAETAEVVEAFYSTAAHNEEVDRNDVEENANPTDLESKLAFNMTTLRTMPAFERYGKFLVNQERYNDAERVYREMYQLALDTDEKSWAATAMMRIGGIYRVQGKTHDAEQMLKRALELKKQNNDSIGESMILTFLADIYSNGKPSAAIESYLAALEANPDLKEPLLSTIKYKVGRAYAEVGNFEAARNFLNEAHAGASRSKNSKLLGAIKNVRKARKLK
jgi:tetratricopeptide (TPR) repeat protein